MEIKNSFEVPGSVELVWNHLLDVEMVAACMPGAQLTETIDDRNYKGKVTIKLGPMSMSFAGTVRMTEVDEDAHRIVLEGKGQEQRGKGAAQATIAASLTPAGTGTRVDVEQDVTVTGQAAQLARGMMQDVTERLTAQFADCLKERMSEEPAAAGTAAGAPADGSQALVTPEARTPPAPTSGAPAGQGHPQPGAATPTADTPSEPDPRSTSAEPVKALSLLWSVLRGAGRRGWARLRAKLSRG